MHSRTPARNIVPTYGSTNYAPVRPLLRLKEKEQNTTDYLCDALRAKYKGLMDHDKPTWKEIIGAGQLIALFIHGKQRLVFNPFAQTYVPVAAKPGEQVTAKGGMNIMQFYSTKHTQQWLGSNPDIEIVAAGDDDRLIAAAKAADIVLDSYERKFYTHSFSIQEAILIQCFGTGINRIRFDKGIKGRQVLRDILEDEEFEMGEGFGACEDCGYSGTAANFGKESVADGVDMPVCPECKSMGVTYEEAPKQILPVVKGREMSDHGDLRIDIVAVPQCRWDLRTKFEDSSWAIVEQSTNLGAIEKFFGGKLSLGEADSENSFAFDAMDAITQLGMSTGGGTLTSPGVNRENRDRNQITVTEMFLSPEDYYDIRVMGDGLTVSGEKLPQGEKLVKLFPEGICVVGLNGLKAIIGIYGERHCDQFATGVYHVKPLSGAGKGLSDMVETQKRLNKLDTQNMEYMQGTATPAILYAKGAISAGEMKYLGHPKANIPIDLQKFPEIKTLAQIVQPLPPQNAGAQFFQYTYNTLNNFMQLQSHVTEFSGGLPNVDNSTATGAQISAALAASLFAPLLAGKCDIRLGNAKNIIALFRRHFPQPSFFPERFKGMYRTSKGKWFAGADIDGDFEFHIIKDSEAPKNQFTKRQEMLEMMTGVFGGFEAFMAAKQQVPQEVNAILKLYDVDLESENYDESGEICRERLDAALSQANAMLMGLAQNFGEQGLQAFDPYIVIQSIPFPIDPFELDQDRKMLWFRRYLDTDEARQLPPELKSVVTAFIGTHFANINNEQAALAAAMGQAQMAMQQPMMEAQMAQMQQQQEMALAQGQQEMEMAEAQHGQQMQHEAQKMEMDSAKKDMDIQATADKESVKIAAKEIHNEMDALKTAQAEGRKSISKAGQGKPSPRPMNVRAG